MRIAMCLVGVLLSVPAVARAQSDEGRKVATVEVMGSWGLQLGDTEYLPDGSATNYKYPFVDGWGAGATAGVLLGDDVALTGTYEYWSAASVKGNVTGVIDRVQGYVRYHTLVLGLRLYRDVGPGRLRAGMGIGVALPFEARTEYDWGEGLAPAGISGTGTRTDQYGLGIGAEGQLGYEVPLGDTLFVAGALQVRSFQSDNNGEQSKLDNIVDLTGNPPTATTATIDYGDGNAQPATYSVQDFGLRVAVGARF